MEPPFALFLLFSLVLFASTTDGRKDPGEYWQGIMKDQPMPEAIQGLIHKGSVLSVSNKRTNCHTPAEVTNKDQPFKEFEPRHKDIERRSSVRAYHDDAKLAEEKSFVKDFEPRPKVFSSYHDDDVGLKEKSYAKDFEPRPNVSSYHDDGVGLKEKSYAKDFEPRPNVSSYHDDGVGLKEKSYVKDFEPRPNVSAYQD